MHIVLPAIISHHSTTYRLRSDPKKFISYRLLLISFSYIVSPAISSHLCVSYNLPSVPISVYRIACLQYPSLSIVTPDICTKHCVSYRLPSFPSLHFVSPVNSSHPLYRTDCQQFPSLYIVSSAISSHPYISYRLPSVPINEYRITCHLSPSLISYSQSVPICVNLIACNQFQSLISYRLPSVPISVYRSPAIRSHLLYLIACPQFPNMYIVSSAFSSQLCISYRLS